LQAAAVETGVGTSEHGQGRQDESSPSLVMSLAALGPRPPGPADGGLVRGQLLSTAGGGGQLGW
jgi:hypothetical protein